VVYWLTPEFMLACESGYPSCADRLQPGHLNREQALPALDALFTECQCPTVGSQTPRNRLLQAIHITIECIR